VKRNGNGALTLGKLEAKFSRWLCQRCREQGCELKYRPKLKARRVLIIDCNKYHRDNNPAGKSADCLFIECTDPLVIAVVELKSGGVDPEKSIEQIQASLTIADQLLSGLRVEVSLPVLVHRKGLHPDDYRIIQRKKVAFRHLNRVVVTARCGDSVSQLLIRYASQYRVP
jgi:hypothetical protein